MNKQYLKNGVEYGHVSRGRWSFKGVRPNGETFTKIERVSGRANADRVAVSVAASLKRNFAGVRSLDPLACGQIAKIIPQMPTYKGNNFSFGATREVSIVS
jgi:hypothetical protein